MLDTVLPFLEYCDVNQIYTIGWDIGGDENTLIMNISIKIPLRTNTLKKKVQLISRKCLKSLSYFFLLKT